jgi:hypothetical protein
MGTFGGHALPGSFFLIFSVWWTYNIFRRYHISQIKGGLPFKASVTFPCMCLCGKLKTWELEGAIKIFFTTVGFTLEIITAFKDGKFTYYGNGQHATMFFFFGLSGAFDIVVHHRIPMPKHIEYVAMTLAFVVEGLLFKFHLHGRDEMDVLLHTLLLYAVYGTIACCFLEMKFRHSAIVILARTYFVALQGSWFWQIGFVLYNPFNGFGDWDHEDHDQMMLITMMFAWHMGGVLLLMMAAGGVMGCLMYRPVDQSNDPMNLQLIKRDANGHTVINLHDSDSEIEFEDFTQSTESLRP